MTAYTLLARGGGLAQTGGIDADPRILLELIGDIQGLTDLDEFRTGVLAALERRIPSDWISLNDIGPDPASTVVVVEPGFPPDKHELFARLAHENPLVARFARTGDGRPYRFSDVMPQAELEHTALYREFYGPIGLRHQIAFTLPHPPSRLLGVALSRRHSDFSDAERALLDEARPFLAQAYRTAVDHSALRAELDHRAPRPEPPACGPALSRRGLTPRESEVLGWVATGRSDLQVATMLGLSERTVQKHLQRSYRKLGVSGRADAAVLAWTLSDSA